MTTKVDEHPRSGERLDVFRTPRPADDDDEDDDEGAPAGGGDFEDDDEVEEKRISAEQRRRIDVADFAWPAERKYPIIDQRTLDAAARLIGRAPADKQPAIKRRAIAIARRRGLKLPESWKNDDDKGRKAASAAPAAAHHAAFRAEVEDVTDGDVIVRLTEQSVDRDGEVVLVDGIETKNYLQNPIVLWSHSRSSLPIGRALWVKPNAVKTALVGRIKFASTAEGKDVQTCVKEGVVSTVSIGFRPIAGGKPTPEEIRAHPEWRGARYIHRKVELLEISFAAIPANPNAVVLAKSLQSAIIRDAILAEAAILIPPSEDEVLPAATLPFLAAVLRVPFQELIDKTVAEARAQMLNAGPLGGVSVEIEPEEDDLGFCPTCDTPGRVFENGLVTCGNDHTHPWPDMRVEPGMPRTHREAVADARREAAEVRRRDGQGRTRDHEEEARRRRDALDRVRPEDHPGVNRDRPKAFKLDPLPPLPKGRPRAVVEKARDEQIKRLAIEALAEAEARRWGAL